MYLPSPKRDNARVLVSPPRSHCCSSCWRLSAKTRARRCMTAATSVSACSPDRFRRCSRSTRSLRAASSFSASSFSPYVSTARSYSGPKRSRSSSVSRRRFCCIENQIAPRTSATNTITPITTSVVFIRFAQPPAERQGCTVPIGTRCYFRVTASRRPTCPAPGRQSCTAARTLRPGTRIESYSPQLESRSEGCRRGRSDPS
jgi:hypothetical protein